MTHDIEELFNYAVKLSRDAAQRYQNMTDDEFEAERVRERAEQLTEPTREEIEADLERRNREWHEANLRTMEQYEPEDEFNPNDNQNFD